MAPQTRRSTLRHSGPAAAPPAKTTPKPTAATTAIAAGRRGRPRKQLPPPTAATSGPVEKPAKRTSRRTRGLPIEYDKLEDSPRKRRQNPSAKPKTKSRRAENTAEAPTGAREEESDEAILRHTPSTDQLRNWLQGTAAIPPPEDIMAGSAQGNAGETSNSRDPLHRQTLQRNAMRSQDQDRAPERKGSAPQTVGSNSTVRPKSLFKEKSYREILEDGTDGVCLIMKAVKDRQSDADLSMESKTLLHTLTTHTRKEDSDDRFHAEAVEALLDRMHMQNERGVSHELHAIICPSAGGLGDISFRDEKLKETYGFLVNQWDEPWSKQPMLLPLFSRPQPDYCVGFSRKAFTKDQRATLTIVASEKTTFMPTSRMYFPFLTCEVKSPLEPLEAAENQNSYSMLVAVRSMVELFRAAKTDFTGSGHVLAFSVSYNHELAYIHAYYPIINGEETTIYRRKVYMYQLSPEETKDTRRSWNFVRNVYEIWAPHLRKRLREAIDAVDLDAVSADTGVASVQDAAPWRDTDAMSLDNDRASNASRNTNRRTAPQKHPEEPSSKKRRT